MTSIDLDGSERVPLLTRLARDFDDRTRQRGADYFRGGRVLIHSAAESGVAATVRGTSDYRVDLMREGRVLRVSCTCPYFDIAPCKHIWAVLIAPQTQRLLQDMSLEGQVRLMPVGADDSDEDADEDFDEDLNAHLNEVLNEYRAGDPLPQPETKGDWRSQLAQLNPTPPPRFSAASEPWPPNRELLYVIDVAKSAVGAGLHLEVFYRDPRKDGAWGKPKSRHLRREYLRQLPDSRDRRILALLAGATELYSHAEYDYGAGGYPDAGGYYDNSLPFRYRLIDPQPELILPMLCETGRCRLRLAWGDEDEQWLPIAWDEGEPWQFRLEVHPAREAGRYEVLGVLLRGQERLDISAPVMLLDAGILFTRECAARYEHHGAFNWIASLRDRGPLLIPIGESDEFLAQLLRQPHLPPLDLPDELRYEEVALAPRPRLTIKPDKTEWRRDVLHAELAFEYGGTVVADDAPGRAIVQEADRRLLLRDLTAERNADQRLQQLGWRRGAPGYVDHKRGLELKASRLPSVVRQLVAEGWHVDAEGKVYRNAGKFDIQVRSGIDWFELHGAVKFGDKVAHLPELLAAVRRGSELVRLDDGTFGLLPQEWLNKYASLAGLGTAQDDHLRFMRSQVGLLDALLASQPEAQCDAVFTQLREQLRGFAGVEPADPPAGFNGELRPYQREGLGWLNFLRQFGFGGCLADDMGLGKTVQVLALLEARRALREQSEGKAVKRQPGKATSDAAPPPPRIGPSLVVMPKSLIFNWKREAARFAPRLRVLDHTGPLRQKGNEHFEDWDVILTTYGTLRSDAVVFKDVRFDYLILDEAQAIKNATSESAKAARLLQGDHRLALSGTPIENHLGELWSLFEFLNPGMLGAASVFRLIQPGTRGPDEQTRKLLAQSLRPFLLRRTKEQVARDLPPKLEETLYCELEDEQRKLYDELRDHYRKSLLERIDSDGIGRAKIQILEALLRLRQAAIHPGLLDKRRMHDASAKLDMLIPRLLEVLDEGHKVLVFSQFTGMLAILREQLDQQGITHEYLDGKTRDREARVQRFQSDPDCKLFLISLKAGGLGLNLTAAQYVFLLDPWWNPAVEAQAVDRAHRIGQTSQVFAYRLIARDTVEEKVLELQNTKRDLADAIVNADNGLIRNLGREDLELLLS